MPRVGRCVEERRRRGRAGPGRGALGAGQERLAGDGLPVYRFDIRLRGSGKTAFLNV